MQEINELFNEINDSLTICEYAIENNNPVLFSKHAIKLGVYQQVLEGIRQVISGNYETPSDSVTLH